MCVCVCVVRGRYVTRCCFCFSFFPLFFIFYFNFSCFVFAERSRSPHTCSALALIPQDDVSSVKNMFYNAVAFNRDLSILVLLVRECLLVCLRLRYVFVCCVVCRVFVFVAVFV